ncbi:MAG: hypothetical protein P4M08_03065 [Oligoflexia bacterium]|nr:hypothetical protein [Oligoflexia bacterium]
MSDSELIPVDLQGAGDKRGSGSVPVKTLSKPERLKRAWKGAGLCIGLAVVCVFLPLIHFVLVPGFLIAAPFVFSWMYSWERVILPCELKCPNCGQMIKISLNKEKWPFREVCVHCRNEMAVLSSASASENERK